MTERPILFSGPMVRAILAGAKTQTRRLVKLPRWAEPGTLEEGTEGVLAVARVSGCLADVPCPYGAPGDDLWVRETWRADDFDPPGTIYAADHPDLLDDVRGIIRWRPSIHMPRNRSRITLRVASVRVERLHDITEDDARAEGVLTVDGLLSAMTPRERFACLWREINGGRASWDANPWVWRVQFWRRDDGGSTRSSAGPSSSAARVSLTAPSRRRPAPPGAPGAPGRGRSSAPTR